MHQSYRLKTRNKSQFPFYHLLTLNTVNILQICYTDLHLHYLFGKENFTPAYSK